MSAQGGEEPGLFGEPVGGDGLSIFGVVLREHSWGVQIDAREQAKAAASATDEALWRLPTAARLKQEEDRLKREQAEAAAAAPLAGNNFPKLQRLAELQERVRKQNRPCIIHGLQALQDYKINKETGVVLLDRPVGVWTALSPEFVNQNLVPFMNEWNAWRAARDKFLAAREQRAEYAKQFNPPEPLPSLPSPADFVPVMSMDEVNVDGKTGVVKLADGRALTILPPVLGLRYAYRVRGDAAMLEAGEDGLYAAETALLFRRGQGLVNLRDGVRIVRGTKSTPRLVQAQTPPLFVDSRGQSNIVDVTTAASKVAEKLLDEPDVVAAAEITSPFIVPVSTGGQIRRVAWDFDGNGSRTTITVGVDPLANSLKGGLR